MEAYLTDKEFEVSTEQCYCMYNISSLTKPNPPGVQWVCVGSCLPLGVCSADGFNYYGVLGPKSVKICKEWF